MPNRSTFRSRIAPTRRRFLAAFIEELEERTPLAAAAAAGEFIGLNQLEFETESAFASSATPTSTSPSSWESQGPIGANHRFLQNIVGGNSIGGATHTVLAHPTDADTLYAGTVNGGVWKTTNATNLIPIWTPQTDSLESPSISAMAFDVTDANFETLVATTAGYSSFGGVSGQRGLVYRTTNGGDDWFDVGGNGILGENLSGVAARGDTIVVTSRGGGGGVFRSTDGGANFGAINSSDFTDNDNFSDLVEDPDGSQPPLCGQHRRDRSGRSRRHLSQRGFRFDLDQDQRRRDRLDDE